MCVFVYVCMYMCAYMYVCMRVCAYACVCVCMHMCMYACVYVCMCACNNSKKVLCITLYIVNGPFSMNCSIHVYKVMTALQKGSIQFTEKASL